MEGGEEGVAGGVGVARRGRRDGAAHTARGEHVGDAWLDEHLRVVQGIGGAGWEGEELGEDVEDAGIVESDEPDHLEEGEGEVDAATLAPHVRAEVGAHALRVHDEPLEEGVAEGIAARIEEGVEAGEELVGAGDVRLRDDVGRHETGAEGGGDQPVQDGAVDGVDPVEEETGHERVGRRAAGEPRDGERVEAGGGGEDGGGGEEGRAEGRVREEVVEDVAAVRGERHARDAHEAAVHLCVHQLGGEAQRRREEGRTSTLETASSRSKFGAVCRRPSAAISTHCGPY